MILAATPQSCKSRNGAKHLFAAVSVMIAMILFSSTSAAARICDAVFYGVLGRFFFAASGHDTIRAIHFVLEKGTHLTLFFVFGLLLIRADFGSMTRRVPFVLAAGAVLGIAAEYLQTFFVGRDPAIRDALIDLFGTCLGVLAVAMFTKGALPDFKRKKPNAICSCLSRFSRRDLRADSGESSEDSRPR